MAESRTSYVYDQIIRGILTGTYRPGQALNRRDVASGLNVSISPVNEAFAILQTEGIVQTIPRKGTFIGRLDWRDLTELTIVRAGLEVEAARAYCGERIASVKLRMFELADRVDKADPASFEHLHGDIVFHRALVALAGNHYLASIFDTVITRSLLLAAEATIATGHKTSKLSHRKFVRDLCAATPESVGELVRRNIFSGKESFLEFDGSTDPDFRPDTALDVILSVMDPATESV
jgi:GntR family transcriptional regulator, rspAB operon transcriptional repressor